jgi:hypothetical protein
MADVVLDPKEHPGAVRGKFVELNSIVRIRARARRVPRWKVGKKICWTLFLDQPDIRILYMVRLEEREFHCCHRSHCHHLINRVKPSLDLWVECLSRGGFSGQWMLDTDWLP